MISCKEAQALTNYATAEIKTEAKRLYKLYFAENIEKQIIEAAKNGKNAVIIDINMHTIQSSDASNVSADLILDYLIGDCPGFIITKKSSESIMGLTGQPFKRTVEISWEAR